MKVARCNREERYTLTKLLEDRNAAIARLQAENEALRGTEQLAPYLRRQWDWSAKTFGPGKRTLGILDHIRKELQEIGQNPLDLSEWIDVMILALDGYCRHGGSIEGIMAHLQAKQDKNFARKWPTPQSEDVAVEHETAEGGQESVGGLVTDGAAAIALGGRRAVFGETSDAR